MLKETFAKIDYCFDLQVKYKSEIQNYSIKKRIQILKKLEKVILLRREQISEALYLDFRKSKIEAESTEIYPVIAEIRHFCKNLEKWAQSKSVSNNLIFFGSKAKILIEPKGNCLIISPWNYPFQLSLIHLVACVAAGNTAIIKPSEFTTHTNKILENIINEVFESYHVSLIFGEIDVTNYLLTKKFDHIHFTGSPKVGKLIMAAGAKNLASVTLELGGKSPLIIDDTFDIQKAVSKALWGKLINNGQTCIAPDYILIHESKLNDFVNEFKLQIKNKFGNNPIQSDDLARIINIKNYNRVKYLIENAIDLGANCPVGNVYNEKELYIMPTLLTNVSSSATIMQEEIFGPVFPILTYNKIEEAIEIINQNEKPLALYIFSNQSKLIEKVTTNTSSGAVMINDLLIHILHPNLPFGGVNNSGIGASTGYFGFLDFSHQKPFLKVNQLTSPTKFLNYPYKSFTQKVINLMIKYF